VLSGRWIHALRRSRWAEPALLGGEHVLDRDPRARLALPRAMRGGMARPRGFGRWN